MRPGWAQIAAGSPSHSRLGWAIPRHPSPPLTLTTVSSSSSSHHSVYWTLPRASSPALGSLIAALVGYCTMNFTGLMFPTGCFSVGSDSSPMSDVWTAVHHRTCRTTASRSLVSTLRGICVPPTVNYLQYLAIGSTLMAVGPSQSPALQSGSLSRIIRDPTMSADCFRRLLKTYLFARY